MKRFNVKFIKRCTLGLRLQFVDDGFADSTAEMLAFLERESPSIRAPYLPVNVGKADAVRIAMTFRRAAWSAIQASES